MNEEQKPTIDERLQALTMNLELEAASVKDLRVVAETMLARQRERSERGAKYLALIGDILRQWAEEETDKR